MLTNRLPAVAGLFYPAESQCLSENIAQLLLSPPPLSQVIPKALIVPHAGYIYSGSIAASAYATLRLVADRIRHVVMLGPAHRVAVRGLALPAEDAFITPLGQVRLDISASKKITRFPQVITSSHAHRLEHSLEVQLPFLQSILTDFSILPLVVGIASTEEVSEVLDCLWGGEETLIIISSDLSHYLPYAAAQREDEETAASILELHQAIDHAQACGATSINGLIAAARKHYLTPHLLDLRNSGDTAGPRNQVVGYGAFAFSLPESGRRSRYAT